MSTELESVWQISIQGIITIHYYFKIKSILSYVKLIVKLLQRWMINIYDLIVIIIINIHLLNIIQWF